MIDALLVLIAVVACIAASIEVYTRLMLVGPPDRRLRLLLVMGRIIKWAQLAVAVGQAIVLIDGLWGFEIHGSLRLALVVEVVLTVSVYVLAASIRSRAEEIRDSTTDELNATLDEEAKARRMTERARQRQAKLDELGVKDPEEEPEPESRSARELRNTHRRYRIIESGSLALVRIAVGLAITVSIGITLSWFARFDYTPPAQPPPCCPDVNVICPGTSFVADSTIRYSYPISHGLDDSSLLELTRTQQQAWLSTLKEENTHQRELLAEQNRTWLEGMTGLKVTASGTFMGWGWYVLLAIVGIGALVAIVLIQKSKRSDESKKLLSLYSFLTALAIACAPAIIELIDHHICGCPPAEKHEDGGHGVDCSCKGCGGHGGDTYIDASIQSEIQNLTLKLENTKLELKQYIDVHCPCPPPPPTVKRKKCVKNSCDVVREIEVLQHRLDSLCTVHPKVER